MGADLVLSVGEHLLYLEFIRVFYPEHDGVSRTTTRRDVIAYYNRRIDALQEEQKIVVLMSLKHQIFEMVGLRKTILVL